MMCGVSIPSCPDSLSAESELTSPGHEESAPRSREVTPCHRIDVRRGIDLTVIPPVTVLLYPHTPANAPF